MQYKLKEHTNKEIQKKLKKIEDITERLLLLRGLIIQDDRESFLSPDYIHDVHDPFLFKEMGSLIKRLLAAKKNKEKIGIYGDYDADGVCGATLLKDVFNKLDFESEVYIPHKERDGHGLSMLAVKHFTKSGVKLLVTVDCGITNIVEIAAAKELGMESIIIDHHSIPKILPDSVAVINPKLPSSGYPFNDLCGTGAAFKVACALYARCAPERSEETKWLLDLVAIATVADMVPLTGENRTLVTYGLIVLAKTQRTGLKELFDVGRIPIDTETMPTTNTIGFQIAPRINAAGRMGHAQDAHDLLIDTIAETARVKAKKLEKLNNERRKVSEKVTKNALAHVVAMKEMPAGIIVGDDEYFHGVVGLAAGRLAEKFKRPVGVFQHRGDISIGSFRSREGIHVVDVLHACKEELPDTLIKYGGHAAAAGATLNRKLFDDFAILFDKHVRIADKKNGENSETIIVDAEITIKEISLELIASIKKFAPFGMENSEPLFALTEVKISTLRPVGKTGIHIKFIFADISNPSYTIDGIGFSLADKVKDMRIGDSVTVLATLEENNWQGRKSVQLMVKDIVKR